MKNRASILVMALILYGCVKVEDDKTFSLGDAAADSGDVQSSEGGEDAADQGADAAEGGAPDKDSERDGTTFDADSTTVDAEAGADAGVPQPESCTDPCTAVGALRCSGDLTHVQSCSSLGADCSSWTDVGACKVDQICCGASCFAVDAAHCYGCTEACQGVTPVCDKGLKKCGCDAASCHALDGKVCDAATHQCTVDPANPDVYVDPAGARPEEGTKDHPYRTITAALLAPRAPGISLTVHVARGRYDKDHGETFPLVLRGASIVGVSPIDTIISGSGAYDARVSAGAINAQVSATIVIGDKSTKSGISNATLYDAANSPVGGRYGVFCDGGNASLASPPANTTLDQLSIGPGYDVEIVATTSSLPSSMGCNLQVTGSDFKLTDTGLWAIGCGNTPAVGARIPVMVQMGDGTQKGGNQLIGFPPDNTGLGARISACVTSFVASYNSFTRAKAGVDIIQPKNMNEINHLIFRHNVFDGLRQFGIRVSGGAAFVDEISNNRFAGIGPLNNPGFAAGLYVEGYQSEQSFAHVSGTNNEFLSNQAGIVFESALPIDPNYVEFSSFSGGNIFHCNAGQASSDLFDIVGGDVIMKTPSKYTFEFNDNEWDHSPPSFSTTVTADGTDVVAVPGVSVTTTNATEVDVGCRRR